MLACLCTGSAAAQDSLLHGRQSIFDELQSPGRGYVAVDQAATVRNLVGRPLNGEVETSSDGRPFVLFQGYRVQVFSGNNQGRSKAEAFKREQDIQKALPTLPTYITYTAPFWRLRVGDFNSHEEAYAAQRQLMQRFPSFGKEMYIVKEDIKLYLDDTY
jgi:hypothetical protein